MDEGMCVTADKERVSPRHHRGCRRRYQEDRDTLEGFPVRDRSRAPVLFMNETQRRHGKTRRDLFTSTFLTGTRLLVLFCPLIS